MKKVLALLSALLLVISFSACNNSTEFDTTKAISVVSREDGSGTRGAFIELFEIQEKADDGSTIDHTTKEAIISRQTDVMMTNISGDNYAIGYISLGSMNEMVKAVQIDGVDATTANVKNGTYTVSRPFNIATKGEPTDLAKDFIDFIMSKEGQDVIGANYIPVIENAPAYSGSGSGILTIGGSSSVTPVMEELKEAYIALNADAEIEIQMTDSSAGMTSAIEGTCDIGMSSRELKDSELAELTPVQIALDGIAIIVNKNNPATNLTKAQVKGIFTGATTTWGGIG